MAKAVPAPNPPPAIEGPVVYEPDEGMTISTVKVCRTQDAFIAVEHPKDWSEEEVLAAIETRQMDFAGKVDWWDAENTTTIDSVALGVNDPDSPHREPFVLAAAEEDEDEGDEDDPVHEGDAVEDDGDADADLAGEDA